MAIKYYSIPEQGKTVAILHNCEFDAINKIEKIVGECDWFWNARKYIMPNQIRVTCKTYGDDVFDEEEGKKIAKRKLMKKYYKIHDAKLKMFYEELQDANKKIADYIEKNSSGNA